MNKYVQMADRLYDQEQQMKRLEKENAELQQKWLDESYEKAKCIKSLDDKNKENNYLSEQIQKLKIELDTPESVVLDKLDEAKDIIRNLLRVTYGEGWNYSLDVKVKAEDFLKEVE